MVNGTPRGVHMIVLELGTAGWCGWWPWRRGFGGQAPGPRGLQASKHLGFIASASSSETRRWEPLSEAA